MGEPIRPKVNTEIPAYRTGLVAALDIGSSKVACVIGRAEGGSMRILGSALRESGGVKAGTVTSLERAEESIRECVAAAENHADARVQNVLISVNCGSPTSITARTAMALDGALVSDAHLRALLAEGRSKCKLDGYEIIQSAPTSYVVDEVRGVRGPLGHVLPAHRGCDARGRGPPEPAAESEARGRALPSRHRGVAVRRLCERRGHAYRG